MSNIKINSDFTDFYDVMSDNNAILTYNRYLKDSKQRGTSMKYLRSLGIKTIELKQVNSFMREDGPIVVYTNPTQHHGLGKQIMSVEEAKMSYGNYTASKYYATEGNYTIKVLQIGSRRFSLTFQCKEQVSLSLGKLVDIKELPAEYNKLINIPIFSIDYVSNGKEMIATDFNEVENLQQILMNEYISSEEIINELSNSLTLYNN